MGWKIYYWIYLVLSVLGVFFILPQLGRFNIWDVVGLVFNFILIVALYAYSYKKKVFEVKYWRVIFYISLLYLFIGIIDLFIFPLEFLRGNIENDYSRGTVIFSWLLSIPVYYPIYKLGFSKK